MKSAFRFIQKSHSHRRLFKAGKATGSTVRKSSLFTILLFGSLAGLLRICYTDHLQWKPSEIH